jgi:hypothetical protein
MHWGNVTYSRFTIGILILITQTSIKALRESKVSTPSTWIQEHITKKKKDMTLIVYIAADNDLNRFAGRNIKQMASIGSNEHLNIAVHLDICTKKNEKVTLRYIILKDKIIHANVNEPETSCMDSGDPHSLISCCKWAIETCPAYEYALILWDHGTGIIDPRNGRILSSYDLFIYNPTSSKYELNRLTNYLDLMESENWQYRGICWDDTTGNYLTNDDLEYALRIISKKLLKGKKLAILGFDACLMSMIEIAHIAKKYANIMVSSQEVILGPGWNYKHVLSLFQNNSHSPIIFAQRMVDAYRQAYQTITDDYTLAAISLDKVTMLEKNITEVAGLLEDCLKNQKSNSVKKAIQVSKNKKYCTHFDEPSYIDIDHFYHNLLNNIKSFKLTDSQKTTKHTNKLKVLLEQGRALIQEAVIANETGENLLRAAGISIYFPERKIHSSYPKTPFASTRGWLDFLKSYHEA